MKVETELTIISGFVGFSLGVCIMMVININNKYKMYEQSIQLDSDTEFLIHENIGDCEDMIEWMKEDIFNGGDSTMYYIYVPKLQNIVDHNRNVLYTTSLEYYELDSDLSVD
jgi:hypothetical protein